MTVQPIWISVSPSHLPALESVHLAFDYYHIDVDAAKDLDIDMKASQSVVFPYMKRYELTDRKWEIDTDDPEHSEESWPIPGVKVQVGRRAAPVDEIMLHFEGHDKPVGTARRGIEGVLKFLESRLQQAELHSSEADWNRLSTLLRAAELERVAMFI